jgi:hypothetical protein
MVKHCHAHFSSIFILHLAILYFPHHSIYQSLLLEVVDKYFLALLNIDVPWLNDEMTNS